MYIPYAGNTQLMMQESNTRNSVAKKIIQRYIHQCRRIAKSIAELKRERWLQA